MVTLLFNISNINHTFLDGCDQIHFEAPIFISRMDVHVQGRTQKSVNTFQSMGLFSPWPLFIEKVRKRQQVWQTFTFGLPRSLANFTIALSQRYP